MAPNYTLRRAVAVAVVVVVAWCVHAGVTVVAGALASAEPRPDAAAIATPGPPPLATATSVPTTTTAPAASTRAEPVPTSAPTRATAPPRDTPFETRGVIVVSKFHPLTRAYVPETGSDPDGLRPEVRAALTRMFADAKAENLPLAVRSGYRNYAVQDASFKRAYAKYGEGARRYYAEAGHSEHQTGLAADLSDGRNQNGSSFAKTPQAAWVAANAHRYGFIVRYPPGKRDVTGVDHEPWHVRFVGVEVATEMARTPGISLEEYLGIA